MSMRLVMNARWVMWDGWRSLVDEGLAAKFIPAGWPRLRVACPGSAGEVTVTSRDRRWWQEMRKSAEESENLLPGRLVPGPGRLWSFWLSETSRSPLLQLEQSKAPPRPFSSASKVDMTQDSEAIFQQSTHSVFDPGIRALLTVWSRKSDFVGSSCIVFCFSISSVELPYVWWCFVQLRFTHPTIESRIRYAI